MTTTRRYRVILSPAASKQLDALPRLVQKAVTAAIDYLESNPRFGKPLAGPLSGAWSLRRGDYRVIYRIDGTASRVDVARIAHRSRVYRDP